MNDNSSEKVAVSSQKNPTSEIYDALLTAYNHFNKYLFGNKLPPVLIVLQRQAKTMGYVSPNRWQNIDGKKTDELAVNPEYFLGFTLSEIFQTLVHEQCHIWQHHYGTPSRKSYHNKEWADKMKSIGLIPSDTGKPGGKQVGQAVADYALIDGAFFHACMRLLFTGFGIPWLDNLPRPAHGRTHSVYTRNGELVNFNERIDRPLVAPLGYKIENYIPPEKITIREVISQAPEILVNLEGDAFAQTITNDEAFPNIYDEIQTSPSLEIISIKESLENTAPILNPALSQGFNFSIAPIPQEKKQTRLKYSCGCGTNIWAKPGISVRCEDCKKLFAVATKLQEETLQDE